MKNAVSKEVAIKDVNAWLDYKKVSQKKRESNSDQIEVLIQAIEEGNLSIDLETFEINHELLFPIGETVLFTYKPRINVGLIHRRLSGIKSGDSDGRFLAYVCTLTGLNSGIVSAVDTEDYGICFAIACFFL